MLPYVTDLDVNGLHVQAPSQVIFLCGGQTTGVSTAHDIQSMRDAFNKIIDFPLVDDRHIVQAEDVTKESMFFDHYCDVLKFETDLAEITELILLFCESAGSLAELGAFAMIDEIAKRLLVIVRNIYWEKESFIKLGPLRSLEHNYGSRAVYIIDDNDIGLVGNDATKIDKHALKKILEEPLKNFLEKEREPTTFDFKRPGHLIKLIVSLIQDYGALNAQEILEALKQLSIDLDLKQVNSYLVCAKAVKWIVDRRKGSNNLFLAYDLPEAANLPLKPNASVKNKSRRRSLIIEYWQKKDPLRHAAIIEIRRESL